MPGGSGLLAIVTSSSSSSRCPPKWKWMRLDAICFRINRGWARKVSSLQQRLALQNFIIFIHPLNFLFVYASTRHHTNSCKISIQKLDIIFPTINTSVCFNLEFFDDSWHPFALSPSIMQNNCNSYFRSIFINAFSRKKTVRLFRGNFEFSLHCSELFWQVILDTWNYVHYVLRYILVHKLSNYFHNS